ncbi:MAG TPA: hypothetical protein VNU19_01230 [Candidatus Acidoferrum sp.]|nr:hypothetical protein [Candidatus Acidoferrum sp.]
MAFSVEDLARTALVRILPRSRYRLAAANDSRFASFAGNSARIAYRQQGATPAFLIFSGPGQDPRAAATAAAAWAEANWRPNAIQRRVSPGVVVVQVAPAGELTKPGFVDSTAVPAAIWTVDSETGRVDTSGQPPGSPSGGEVRHAGAALAQGLPAPSLGELDHAEREIMQMRTRPMPQGVGGIVGIVLVLFALRYGFGVLTSIFSLATVLQSPDGVGSRPGGQLALYGELVANLLILLGILVGLGVLFNIGNLAARLPGFSSPASRTRTMTWVGYVAVMVVLAVALNFVLPGAAQSAAVNGAQDPFAQGTVTATDDGSEAFVTVGGGLTVDLSSWPSSEWAGVTFMTSNPSILNLDQTPSAGSAPVAVFAAQQVGTARVDAASSDGRYTFELRVNVVVGG